MTRIKVVTQREIENARLDFDVRTSSRSRKIFARIIVRTELANRLSDYLVLLRQFASANCTKIQIRNFVTQSDPQRAPAGCAALWHAERKNSSVFWID